MKHRDHFLGICAFGMCTLTAAMLFGSFATWALDALAPAQRDVIAQAWGRLLPVESMAAERTPGIAQRVVYLEPVDVVGHRRDSEATQVAQVPSSPASLPAS
jgi:hypothetical protein